MVRTECAGCGHAGLTVFADLGETPLADVFPADAESAVSLPRYPLRAATCDKCGLAQLLDVVDDTLLYGEDYGFRTGGSPSSLSYMHDLAKFCHNQRPGEGQRAVEIGCNDGTLLRKLAARGFWVTGVDPSGAAAEAAGDNQLIDVFRAPFTADFARSVQPADLIVAVNVAAHVQDPHDFLEGIRLLLKNDGIAVVEFQYLPDLLAGCMFDLIYHEHRFFYSLTSFAEIAEQHGLYIQDRRHTPAQGGSLRLTLMDRPGPRRDWFTGKETAAVAGLLAGFQQRAEYARAMIRDVVKNYPGKVYGYAASAKSCTLLNWCGLGPAELPYIADATPSKWGRYAPGSGIQIVNSACDPGADGAYLLLASNYLSGVLRREQEAGYKGQFIVPLPLPVIV